MRCRHKWDYIPGWRVMARSDRNMIQCCNCGKVINQHKLQGMRVRADRMNAIRRFVKYGVRSWVHGLK